MCIFLTEVVSNMIRKFSESEHTILFLCSVCFIFGIKKERGTGLVNDFIINSNKSKFI